MRVRLDVIGEESGNFGIVWSSKRGMKAFSAALLVCVLLAGCRSESDSRQGDRSVKTPPITSSAPPQTLDGWRVGVSVDRVSLGPITVSVGPVEAAPGTGARPWVQHEVLFENSGDDPVQFVQMDTSAFIGPRDPRRLLAADETCGYTVDSPTSPVKAGACRAVVITFELEPHGSARRTITLFKGLRGMGRLIPGTYVFTKHVRFAVGGEIPAPSGPPTATLRVTYRIERATA